MYIHMYKYCEVENVQIKCDSIFFSHLKTTVNMLIIDGVRAIVNLHVKF